MTYQQAEEYILSIPKFSSKNSMEDTRMFLEYLGNPDHDMKIIHVAGTNGKGSVCAFLSSVLVKGGYHVGTFVSPHLVTMRERFLFDRQMISEEAFLQAFLEVKDALQAFVKGPGRAAYHPSFFEYLFFMAMAVYRRRKPDYLILETGLGGRLDATNAVGEKTACVITSIGYDHMEYLGDTIEQIAGEKAGIMRKGVPVIFSDRQDEAAEIIKKCAEAVETQVCGVKKEDYQIESIFPAGIDFSFHSTYYGYIRFSVPSAGVYQAENAALALRTLELIGTKEVFSADVLRAGIADAFWEARMELILPGIYLDGAHNADGVQAFIQSVQKQTGRENGACQNPVFGKKRMLLYSVVKDKQYETVLRLLTGSGLFDKIGIVQLADARGLSIERMQEVLDALDVSYVVYRSLDEAMRDIRRSVEGAEYTAYIAGSLYLAGEVKAWLSEKV